PETLRVEQGLDASLRAELAARGHAIEEVDHSAVVQLVRIAREDGRVRLVAASDPRKGGRPAGR
ncbi:MAG TPA: gamma-glutamyltransferase, partial [Sandaracinaceae bacterium]